MKLQVFSVFDAKALAYSAPMFVQSKGIAIRSFAEVANDKEHQIGKYPEDFTLFHVGTWEDSDCSFVFETVPIPIGKGIEFVKV